jgi:hypothetical protein
LYKYPNTLPNAYGQANVGMRNWYERNMRETWERLRRTLLAERAQEGGGAVVPAEQLPDRLEELIRSIDELFARVIPTQEGRERDLAEFEQSYVRLVEDFMRHNLEPGRGLDDATRAEILACARTLDLNRLDNLVRATADNLGDAPTMNYKIWDTGGTKIEYLIRMVRGLISYFSAVRWKIIQGGPDVMRVKDNATAALRAALAEVQATKMQSDRLLAQGQLMADQVQLGFALGGAVIGTGLSWLLIKQIVRLFSSKQYDFRHSRLILHDLHALLTLNGDKCLATMEPAAQGELLFYVEQLRRDGITHVNYDLLNRYFNDLNDLRSLKLSGLQKIEVINRMWHTFTFLGHHYQAV